MTKKQKKHLTRIITAAMLLAVVWLLLPLEGVWQLLAYCVPYFIVGWDVLWGALRKILHGMPCLFCLQLGSLWTKMM